ncbi:hypothetical protein F5Y10DRAFT_232366 [Nemania abortiva]|nr:hypothetical protein F5Y10DRAFT_232366 [Nemania abortiva]
MKRALKRRRAEDIDGVSYEDHSLGHRKTGYSDGDTYEGNSSNVSDTDHQDPDQGGIELSGHGIVNSNSRLEIGRDFKVVHIVNHGQPSTADIRAREKARAKEMKEALKRQRRDNLSTLEFPQIGLREMNVDDAHTATCRWFLRKPVYLNWLDENQFGAHNGLLWIKGKPGAGKSTLMKYVLSQIRRDEKWELVISFFFYARGEELEKSTIGLYRSLLVQLFNERPHLEALLDSLLASRQWTVRSLESLFKSAVLALEDTTLVCLIDALDECDESQIRRMLSFLFSLNSLPDSDHRPRLLVCFASRYYPNITIQRGLIVHLEDQDEHRDDISRYIDSMLNIGGTDLAKTIRSDLWNRASGVFMWVVMAVAILNREYDSGRPDRLRQRLRDIPTDLHELFHDILTRDEKNTDGLLCCIQWILFSVRPLSPQELYFATLSGVEPQSVLACHSDVSIENMNKYVLDISKGLAEIVGTESPVVQFIHESVQDFLLSENGMGKIWEGLGSNVRGYSHEKLRSCCAEYILSVDETIRSYTKESASTLPFLKYATKYILQHAEEAGRRGISQSHFLSTFPKAIWIPQSNIYKRLYARYNPDTTLLYILAEMNLPTLIRSFMTDQSCFTVEKAHFRAPILAALATGSGKTAQALLEVQARRLPLDYPGLPLIQRLLREDLNPQRYIQDFTSLQDSSMASCLAQSGSEAALRLFLATEDVDFDSVGVTALASAARFGHEAVVKLLLVKGVDIDLQDEAGRTPLSWATGWGEAAVARLLLERGANANCQDTFGWTPLSWAVARSHRAVVRLLLANDANVNLSDNESRSPLFLAVVNGDRAVCQLLIEAGADINAQDNVGRTPLSWAVGYNQKDVTLFLLDRGARTDVLAYIGGPLLSWASACRHTALGQLLLGRISR